MERSWRISKRHFGAGLATRKALSEDFCGQLGRRGGCRGLLSQGAPNSLSPQLGLLMASGVGQWVKIITH